jgi:tetratricopeptide (TPR) repeat protein
MTMRILSVLLLSAFVFSLGACSRNPFERFFASGERYLAAHKFAEAAIELENAARVNPQSAAAQLKLGDAYLALKQPARAAAAYERACTLAPEDTATCLRAAEHLLAVGEYERSAQQARAVLSADRFNIHAHLILSSALSGSRRFAEAEERIEALLAIIPQDARAYRALGDLQRQRGNAGAAEISFKRAAELDPSSAAARVGLAQLYLEAGRSTDGERELQAALKADPDDLLANRTYANYLVGTDKCEDAESYWLKAAAQSNDPSDVIALADYYVFIGRPDDALRVLKGVTDEQDPSGAARSRVASILYDRGDRKTAEGLVDGLLGQNQSSVNGLVLKARMALDARDTAEAREYAHRAAAVDPESPAVRDLLAALSEGGR